MMSIHHSASLSKTGLRQASTRNGTRNTKSQASHQRPTKLTTNRELEDTQLSISQNLNKVPEMRTPNRQKSHLTSTADGLANTTSSIWTSQMNNPTTIKKNKTNRAKDNTNAYGFHQPVLGGPDSIEQRTMPRGIHGRTVTDKFTAQVKRDKVKQNAKAGGQTTKDWSKFKHNMQSSNVNDTTIGTMSTLHRHADSRERLGTSNMSYGGNRAMLNTMADRSMTG